MRQHQIDVLYSKLDSLSFQTWGSLIYKSKGIYNLPIFRSDMWPENSVHHNISQNKSESRIFTESLESHLSTEIHAFQFHFLFHKKAAETPSGGTIAYILKFSSQVTFQTQHPERIARTSRRSLPTKMYQQDDSNTEGSDK